MVAQQYHAFLTAKELARILQCSNTKLYGWIESGVVPAVNVSTSSKPSYRIDPLDLPSIKAKLSAAKTPAPKRKRPALTPIDPEKRRKIRAQVNKGRNAKSRA
jgi:hypothetical protein